MNIIRICTCTYVSFLKLFKDALYLQNRGMSFELNFYSLYPLLIEVEKAVQLINK